MNHKQAASASATGKILEVSLDRPYRTIQAAVDEAEEGSDIHVYPGRYVESVSVTKNYLQIMAQGDGVVMEPPHTAGFLVNADHVAIRGFEFRLANECANAVRIEGSHNSIVKNTCIISHSPCVPGFRRLCNLCS